MSLCWCNQFFSYLCRHYYLISFLKVLKPSPFILWKNGQWLIWNHIMYVCWLKFLKISIFRLVQVTLAYIATKFAVDDLGHCCRLSPWLEQANCWFILGSVPITHCVPFLKLSTSISYIISMSVFSIMNWPLPLFIVHWYFKSFPSLSFVRFLWF